MICFPQWNNCKRRKKKTQAKKARRESVGNWTGILLMESALVLCQSLLPCWYVFPPFHRYLRELAFFLLSRQTYFRECCIIEKLSVSTVTCLNWFSMQMTSVFFTASLLSTSIIFTGWFAATTTYLHISLLWNTLWLALIYHLDQQNWEPVVFANDEIFKEFRTCGNIMP